MKTERNCVLDSIPASMPWPAGAVTVVDPAGNVFVGGYFGTSSIFKFTAPHTGSVFADASDAAAAGAPNWAPHDIAFDSTGNVYISDEGGSKGNQNNAVLQFDSAGNHGMVFADSNDGLITSTGLAFDAPITKTRKSSSSIRPAMGSYSPTPTTGYSRRFTTWTLCPYPRPSRADSPSEITNSKFKIQI